MKKLGCISLLIFSFSLHAHKKHPEQQHIFFAQLLGATLMGGATLTGVGTYASLQNIRINGATQDNVAGLIALAGATAIFLAIGTHYLDQAERHI